jgi:hypothetical protein
MAKQNQTASQNQEAKAAQAAEGPQIVANAPIPREVVIQSLTYDEASAAALGNARWTDVVSAAKAFVDGDGGLADQVKKQGAKATPASLARTLGALRPKRAAAFRFALTSYSLSGRTANATQLAELASIMPELKTKGGLRDKAVQFGGLVLPPLTGEL